MKQTDLIKEYETFLENNAEQAPELPYDALGGTHYLFDLVYNPERTLFLQRGAEHGAHTLNGLPMLEAQAEASWRIWNGPIF